MISAPPPLRVNSPLLSLLPTYLALTPRRSVGSLCGIPLVEVPALSASRSARGRILRSLGEGGQPGVLAILADPLNPTGAVALLADGTVLGPRQTPLRTA